MTSDGWWGELVVAEELESWDEDDGGKLLAAEGVSQKVDSTR